MKVKVRVLKSLRTKERIEKAGSIVELEESVAKVLISKKAAEAVKTTTK